METLSISSNVKSSKTKSIRHCGNFFLNGAKCNVIKPSEVSKILKELTECIAKDKEFQACQKTHYEEKIKKESNFCNSEYLDSKNILDPTNKSDTNSSELSVSTFPSLMETSSLEGSNSSKKFICQTCGKSFNKKDFLQKHKIVHEAPRHRCVICDKCFMREDKLKRHFLSIHSKYRPHVCQLCSKAFARKDKLKDHQKHHITAGDNFHCCECNISFVQKSDLNRHSRLVHAGKKVEESKDANDHQRGSWKLNGKGQQQQQQSKKPLKKEKELNESVSGENIIVTSSSATPNFNNNCVTSSGTAMVVLTSSQQNQPHLQQNNLTYATAAAAAVYAPTIMMLSNPGSNSYGDSMSHSTANIFQTPQNQQQSQQQSQQQQQQQQQHVLVATPIYPALHQPSYLQSQHSQINVTQTTSSSSTSVSTEPVLQKSKIVDNVTTTILSTSSNCKSNEEIVKREKEAAPMLGRQQSNVNTVSSHNINDNINNPSKIITTSTAAAVVAARAAAAAAVISPFYAAAARAAAAASMLPGQITIQQQQQLSASYQSRNPQLSPMPPSLPQQQQQNYRPQASPQQPTVPPSIMFSPHSVSPTSVLNQLSAPSHIPLIQQPHSVTLSQQPQRIIQPPANSYSTSVIPLPLPSNRSPSHQQSLPSLPHSQMTTKNLMTNINPLYSVSSAFPTPHSTLSYYNGLFSSTNLTSSSNQHYFNYPYMPF